MDITAANVIHESHTMDYTARVEHAMNAAGQWFKRIQYRDQRYGYKWTAWSLSSGLPETAFSTGRKARLPR